MPQVRISGHFLKNNEYMMRIVDAGYVLTNKIYDRHTDIYTFQIAGPDVPQCDFVDIWMNDEGKTWCEEQKALSAQSIAEIFKIPPQIIAPIPKSPKS